MQKFEAGAFDEDAEAGQVLELEILKGGSSKRTTAEKRAYVRDHRPRCLSVAEGCRLMGIARSTY